MSLLDRLLQRRRGDAEPQSADTVSVRKIVGELEAMEPQRARYVGAFAYILARVANADMEISSAETHAMERIVEAFGGLSPAQAALAVGIAKHQSRLFGGTEDFLVTREFLELSTREQRHQLLDCLFAVSAADDSISSAEEAQVRQIASELRITHKEYVQARLAYSDKREVLKQLRQRRDRPDPDAPPTT